MLVVPLLPTAGATPLPSEPYADFRPVVIPQTIDNQDDIPTPRPVSVIHEGFELGPPKPRETKIRAQIEPQARVIKIKPPPVKKTNHPGNGSIRGVASWYCSASQPVCHYQYPPGSMVAAACGRLRSAMGPNWRGKTVTVVRGSRSVNVKLVDYCAHPDRVLDLYYEPMSRLGGTGILNVTVSW